MRKDDDGHGRRREVERETVETERMPEKFGFSYLQSVQVPDASAPGAYGSFRAVIM